jgi:DnaJ-class molecular chaperone
MTTAKKPELFYCGLCEGKGGWYDPFALAGEVAEWEVCCDCDGAGEMVCESVGYEGDREIFRVLPVPAGWREKRQ